MSHDRLTDGLLRVVLVVLLVLVLVPVFLMALAMPMMGMMMGWDGGMMGGTSWVWGVGMMLLWVVVLVGIGYLAYRGLRGSVGPAATTDPALEELRLAYARGDLSEEEFETRREKLRRE